MGSKGEVMYIIEVERTVPGVLAGGYPVTYKTYFRLNFDEKNIENATKFDSCQLAAECLPGFLSQHPLNDNPVITIRPAPKDKHRTLTPE